MKKPLGLEMKLLEEMQVNNLHFLFKAHSLCLIGTEAVRQKTKYLC